MSGAILGEQALAVTDDKVSVLELRVQPVMGISLALSRGTAHSGEVTATCWAQSAVPGPKQVMAVGTAHPGFGRAEREVGPCYLDPPKGFQNKCQLPGR